MDKENWKKVEDALSGTYGSADMKVDGFTISFYRVLISKNRLGIIMCVDGWMKGKWLINDCPENKFLRPCKKYLYSKKDREALRKLRKGSKRLKGCLDPDKIYEYKHGIWNSVASIRKYYEKTFKNIKLIKINGEDCG